MKKTLLILFILLLSVMLITVSFANELQLNEDEASNEGSEIKEYIEDKIVPVLLGVITSVIALLSTLKCIFSALKSLKDTKEAFDKEREKYKEESKTEISFLVEKCEEIKESVKEIFDLKNEFEGIKNQTDVLAKEISNLSSIANLGFSKDENLIKEGVARKIAILDNQNKELIKNETI